MRERVAPLQQNDARKVSGESRQLFVPFLRVLELENWISLSYFFLEVAARKPLSLSDDKHDKQDFSVRPQTDLILIVSSKLLLHGASRRPGRPF